jgi:hypothetical protein
MTPLALTAQYNQLLLKICIQRASQQMKEHLVIQRNHAMYLEAADVMIIPWNTESIVNDNGVLNQRLD